MGGSQQGKGKTADNQLERKIVREPSIVRRYREACIGSIRYICGYWEKVKWKTTKHEEKVSCEVPI